MFGKRRVYVFNEFGNMEYQVFQWKSTEKSEITLWGNPYKIWINAVGNSEKDDINAGQESAYKKYKETVQEHQKEIEDAVAAYFGTEDKQVLISKFTPTSLLFSKKDECALLADNADDDDSQDPPLGLAVSIYPRLLILTEEEYAGYIFGGGSFFTEQELYGDVSND